MMPIEETGKTKEQMQRDYAEKQHKVTSQQERLSNPILWAFWLYSAVAAGFIANQIWSGPFHDFGGTLFRVIMIALFAVVGLIAAVIAYFFVGVFNTSLDQGFVKGGRAAVISLIGIAIGAAIGAVKGASFTVPSGLLIGLWIGLYVSGVIMAIVATIIFKVTHRVVAEASPWYVKASDRIVILKSEVVELPPKESPPKESSSPPQTNASMPQEAPQGVKVNPVGYDATNASGGWRWVTNKYGHHAAEELVITFTIVEGISSENSMDGQTRKTATEADSHTLWLGGLNEIALMSVKTLLAPGSP